MNESRARRLAFTWHLIEFSLAAIGLAWSAYFLLRPPALVETNRP